MWPFKRKQDEIEVSLQKKLIDKFTDLRLEYELLRRDVAVVAAKQEPFTITRESIQGLDEKQVDQMANITEKFKGELKELLALQDRIAKETSFDGGNF